MKARHSIFRDVLTAVDGFAALTAVGGGVALLFEGDRLPLRLLEGTPFSDYTIPGALLTGVVGGSAAAAAIAMWRGTAAGGWASAFAGLVMMSWIGGEIALLRRFTWIEGIYFGVGLVMSLMGLELSDG